LLTKISGFESNLARLKKENGMDIEFVFEEKKYRVDKNAVELNLIVLPSGEAIKAHHWEKNPPRPVDLHRMETLFQDLSPKSRAIILGGVLAQEV